MSNSVVITSACRTAVGSLGKSLKNISASELGSTVISESIKRSKLKVDDVDEVFSPVSHQSLFWKLSII